MSTYSNRLQPALQTLL